MMEISKLLPDIQQESLQGREIKRPAVEEGEQALTLKQKSLILKQFYYGQDQFVGSMIPYGYGLVPEIITNPLALKQAQQEQQELLAPGSSSSSSSKKNKKKRK